MFQERERINFSEQFLIPVPWSSLQPLNIPLYLSPLPRNINEISIQFLDPAQSPGPLGEVLTSALGAYMAACGRLENKITAPYTHPITMVEDELKHSL